VNRGTVKDFVTGVKSGQTAIDKRPTAGPVAVGRLGLAGDEQADKENHGGAEQALYVYAREDLDWWTEQLGRELRDGIFGENITTAGIDVSAALIGETWRLGTAVVQITSPRIPCNIFKTWMDEPHWVKRFAAAGRPGGYLRVLTEGTAAAGDELTVLSRPAVAVTVAEAMQAFYGDRQLLARLLRVEGRGSGWDEIGAEQGLSAGGRPAVPAAEQLSSS
jgi:MOSC domain-containing protein YiiM